MPFVKHSMIANKKRSLLGRRLLVFFYGNWHSSRIPVLLPVHSDSKYLEGLNSRYLSRQQAQEIRDDLGKNLARDSRGRYQDFVSTLNKLKTQHRKAYDKCYRKYFLKWIVVLKVYDLPVDSDESKELRKYAPDRANVLQRRGYYFEGQWQAKRDRERSLNPRLKRNIERRKR